jgi:hypothetical protein
MNELEALKKDVQFDLDDIEKSKVESSSIAEEFVGYTEDEKEWRKLVESDETKQRHSDMKQEVIFDDEIIKNATGFALGPVILYKKKAYEMFSNKAKSLEEIKQSLKDKNYILYYILYKKITHEIEYKTFEVKQLDTPKDCYIFRGCFLDENLKDQIIKRNKELLVDILIEK